MLAGAALALAFAPLGFWPLAILAPAVLFAALATADSARRAAWLGFCFGLGTFAAGTYWLEISIHGFGRAPLALALGLMAGLVALMAAYHAVLGFVAARWLPTRGAFRYLLGLPAAWTLLEWLRGWALSGFGWLSLGYSQSDTWLAGLAPLGGVPLLTFVLTVQAGALVWAWQGDTRARSWAVVILIVPWLAGRIVGTLEFTRAIGAPVGVAVVQGAIPQDQKWLDGNRDTTLARYRELTKSALGTPVIVWPESAAPDLANNLVPYLRELAGLAAGARSALVLGLIRAEPGPSGGRPQYFNSVLGLDTEVAWYDKHHLVPFAEFFPVPDFVRAWLRVLDLPYSDFTKGAAVQAPLTVAGIKLSASVCYEDAYSLTRRVTDGAAHALVNVTNDAWFGRSTARYQHLQIARLRALESQRFLIRAANDGVSAVIGPRGELVAVAPEYTPTVLRAALVPRSGITPYQRFGNPPVLLLATLALLVAVRVRRRELSPASPV